MSVMSLVQSSQNCRKKDKKSEREKDVMIIEKKDLEELLMKLNVIIDALLILANDHMDQKDHWINILNLNITKSMKNWTWIDCKWVNPHSLWKVARVGRGMLNIVPDIDIKIYIDICVNNIKFRTNLHLLFYLSLPIPENK